MGFYYCECSKGMKLLNDSYNCIGKFIKFKNSFIFIGNNKIEGICSYNCICISIVYIGIYI